jgi:4-amino-4-deoxy-L-arabinose transferase-like glycosyltransferase
VTGGNPSRDMRAWVSPESLALLVVVVLVGAILVSLGLRQYVGYDSFWHVFIARQDTWLGLWQEIADNAHPPLYYLSLRAAIAVFGYNLLAYRLVSIAAILVSIPLLARVVARVTGNRPLGIVAGAAFGLSFCAMDVGLEVRAYALLISLLLTAFLAYLDWLDADPGRAPLRSRVVFAASLSAAVLTHYSAFFFVGAALATLGVLAVAHERWRARLSAEARHHTLAFGGMFAVPVVAAAGAYLLHMRDWLGAGRLNHVPDFMYDPGRESVLAFLGRTTRNLVVLFFPGLGAEVVIVAAVMLLSFTIWLLTRQTVRASLSAVPLVFLFFLLVLNVAAGVANRYPYGGELRHAIFLFPFAVVALFTVWECVRRAAPIRWAGGKAWVGASAVGVTVSFGLWFVPFHVDPTLGKQMDEFRAVIRRPPAVLVDQFSFILFFGHHHDWSWKLEWQDRRRSMWQVWTVSKPGERFAVCRSRQWQLDFTQMNTYEEFADCMDNGHAASVGVFRLAHMAATWKVESALGFAQQIGPQLGVIPEVIVTNSGNLYGAFRRADASDAEHRISVREATYGGNCGATAGNASSHVSRTCADRSLCLYRIDSAVLGDPAYGCAKDFKVQWTCGRDGRAHEASIAAEAGFGDLRAVLTCLP